jgi:hypothetical protein
VHVECTEHQLLPIDQAVYVHQGHHEARVAASGIPPNSLQVRLDRDVWRVGRLELQEGLFGTTIHLWTYGHMDQCLVWC